jgi:two-component system sensor histidine kinase AgrC
MDIIQLLFFGLATALGLYVSIKIIIKDKSIVLKELVLMILVGLIFSFMPLFLGPSLDSAMWFFVLILFLVKMKNYSLASSVILAGIAGGIILAYMVISHILFFILNLFVDSFYFEMISYGVAYLVFAVLLSLLVVKKSENIRKKIKQNVKTQNIIIAFIMITLLSTVILLEIINYLFISEAVLQYEIGIIWILVVYTIILLISFLLYFNAYKVKEQAERKQAEHLAYQHYVKEVEAQAYEIRKFKHDYENILLSLNNFIIDDNMNGLSKFYNEKITSTIERMNLSNFQLENINKIQQEEIKGILIVKLMRAQNLGIDVQFEANDQIAEIAIDTIDLIRIIGILLDNAIEELVELTEKELYVGLLKDNNNVTFIVENTCRENLPNFRKLKQVGYTTKTKGQGIGLSNLADIISNYENVTVKTRINETIFVVEITIQGVDA